MSPKKRSPGDGGLYYIKARGLWRGVVDVGFWPDGRRKQKSVTAKTQTAARQKLDALKAELAEHGAPLDKTMTVETWANRWLDTVCRPNLKPNTLKAYQSLIHTWVVPTIGRKRVSLLKPSDLREVSKAITDAGRSSSTALKVHNIMSAMLEAARLDGVTGRNIAKDVTAPRAAVSTRDALTTEEAFALLREASQHVDGTRWLMAVLTGMRQGERIGATLDSIDFTTNTFTVQWSLTEARFEHGCGGTCGAKRGGGCPDRRLILPDGFEHRVLDGRLILVRPKSGKVRVFPLIPQLADALKRYLAATITIPNPHGLIWRNGDGTPITPTQDNDDWRMLLYGAGVITEEQAKAPKDRAPGTPDAPTTHWARHTTATVLMELGVDARIVGEIVGHASTRITNRYQHVSSAAARAAMESIGGHFQSALEP
jgi:integrase